MILEKGSPNASASLQALLGLNQNSWSALSKLLQGNSEAADEIIALFRQVSVLMSSSSHQNSPHDPIIEVPVNVKLWRVPGCHELLASLGFDLMEVGKQDVILKTGKQANKRQIHYALQALLALFETQDAPRSLEIDDDDEDTEDEDTNEERVGSGIDESPFAVLRKGGSIVLEGPQPSAFSSYVRKRGEPDGRQAGTNDSPTQPSSTNPHPKMYQPPSFTPQTSKPSIPPPPIPPLPPVMVSQGHIKGHESDCNFTPSPVEPMFSKGISGGSNSKIFGTLPSDQGSPITHGLLSQHSHHQYLGRPESSSSVGSFERNDHNHGFNNPLPAMRKHVILKASQPRHLHHGSSVQQRINQALDLISNDVANLNVNTRSFGAGNVPLYENSSMEFTARQPAGKPVTPIRSVFTDVGYQRKLIHDTSDPNDKFSVRAEAGRPGNLGIASTASSTSVNSGGSSATSSNRGSAKEPTDPRLNPGVIRRVPPTGESGSPEAGPRSGTARRPSGRQEEGQSQPNQSTGMSQVPLIGEVYHERNFGLGIAPPLSKLIMSNNLKVVQAEHHSDSDSSSLRTTPKLVQAQPAVIQPHLTKSDENLLNEESLNSIDNLSVIEEAHQRNSIASCSTNRTVIIKEDSGLPSQPSIGQLKPPVLPAAVVPSVTKRKPVALPRFSQESQQTPWYKTLTRDDGDGRSMTDSQYSGYSPGGSSSKGHLVGPKSLSSQISYMKMKDYMNDQEITVLEEKELKKPSEEGIHNPSFEADDKFRPVASPGAAGKLRPLEVAQYINTQLKMPEPNQHIHKDTRHPQQLWSRDRNGGLTYTGMFSSDC